jgi:lactoylglutathione lyase
MRYLHTMVRVKDVDQSLHFYCNLLGLEEFSRKESEKGRFTLIFLCAPEDRELAEQRKAPLLELTYNWPDENGEQEDYTNGRAFGHLAYRVENIYETCQKLMDGGVTINRPPRDGHMTFVKSPDGISIEILQEGDPLEPQEPWVSMENEGSW